MKKSEAASVTEASRRIGVAFVHESQDCNYQDAVEGDMQATPDELLTLAAKSGNNLAFDELCRRHSKRIQRHIYRILRNWEDTEDVLQDSLLKAYGHIGQFRNECSFSTWLTRIAINSSLMVLRKRRAHAGTSHDNNTNSTEIDLREFPDLSPSPELLCADRQVDEMLRSAILQLPWCFRSVAELHLAKECSTNEVAQTLGISVAAVKSRLLRAKKALRTSLPELQTMDRRRPARMLA